MEGNFLTLLRKQILKVNFQISLKETWCTLTQSKPLQKAAGCGKLLAGYCSFECRFGCSDKDSRVPNKDSAKKRTGVKNGNPSPDESPAYSTAENHSPDVLTELCNSLADDDDTGQSRDTANTGGRIRSTSEEQFCKEFDQSIDDIFEKCLEKLGK